ncbi:hypothetical protein [Sulfurimonas sp.]|uniref:hypothetical protein n=1 Tax=Sulfurimonas sp. TaxID=2022749 RepID=UPI00286E04DB|nr:hypothetical protein [Sulfurimonas sp.]
MQKKISLCLYLSVPLFLVANEYPDKGIYGSLGFLYTEDEYAMASQHNTKENFTQELKLGYGGNIYSPKLLDYIIEGTLRNDDENFKTDSYESKQKSVGQDYKVNLNFIKDTNFPFTLYANRYEKPVNTVYNAYATRYIYETSSEGATGTLKFEPYTVTYGAANTKTISEFSDRLQESQTTTYNTSIRYGEKAHNFQASYVHSELENEQQYIDDAIVGVNQIRDMVNITDSWKATDDLNVYSSVSYENDETYLSESIDANFNLYWSPKDSKYDGSLSLYGSQIEYADPLGGGADYLFNSININEILNYKLTETIVLSESAMVYLYDATSIKGTNSYINLYATHNYATTLFENMPFTLTTRAGVQRNDTKYEMAVESAVSDTPTSTSVDRYDLDILARVRRELPSINSSINFYSGYYNSITSMKEEEQRYNFDIYLLSKLYSIVNNNITARYMQTERSNVSPVDKEIIESDYSYTSIMEALDFSFNLGFRGKIRFLVGAEYVNRKNNDQTESGVNPRADMNMNYRLFQNWTFDAYAKVSEMYNTVDHSGSANLNFRAGKTKLLMGYQYNKSQVEGVLSTINNERSLLKVQLIREF